MGKRRGIGNDLVEVLASKKAETELSYLIYTDDPEKAVWVAKTEVEEEESKGANVFTYTMPEWLAYESGLI